MAACDLYLFRAPPQVINSFRKKILEELGIFCECWTVIQLTLKLAFGVWLTR